MRTRPSEGHFVDECVYATHPNVKSINSGVEYRDADDNIIESIDEELADAEYARLHAEYDAQDYSRKRFMEYMKLKQFELIGEDSINGTTNHKDAILDIKARFPKPTEQEEQ